MRRPWIAFRIDGYTEGKRRFPFHLLTLEDGVLCHECGGPVLRRIYPAYDARRIHRAPDGTMVWEVNTLCLACHNRKYNPPAPVYCPRHESRPSGKRAKAVVCAACIAAWRCPSCGVGPEKRATWSECESCQRSRCRSLDAIRFRREKRKLVIELARVGVPVEEIGAMVGLASDEVAAALAGPLPVAEREETRLFLVLRLLLAGVGTRAVAERTKMPLAILQRLRLRFASTARAKLPDEYVMEALTALRQFQAGRSMRGRPTSYGPSVRNVVRRNLAERDAVRALAAGRTIAQAATESGLSEYVVGVLYHKIVLPLMKKADIPVAS